MAITSLIVQLLASALGDRAVCCCTAALLPFEDGMYKVISRSKIWLSFWALAHCFYLCFSSAGRYRITCRWWRAPQGTCVRFHHWQNRQAGCLLNMSEMLSYFFLWYISGFVRTVMGPLTVVISQASGSPSVKTVYKLINRIAGGMPDMTCMHVNLLKGCVKQTNCKSVNYNCKSVNCNYKHKAQS